MKSIRTAAALVLALCSLEGAQVALADAKPTPKRTELETTIRKADLRTSLSTYLFLNRNAATLRLVQNDECSMESLEKALSIIGDDGSESSFTSLNLKVYNNRHISSVSLSLGDDDGSTESGVTLEFDVNTTTNTILKNEVRCFFAG